MPAAEAVSDFLSGVRTAAAAAKGPVPTVCVFLDGENCWEHYRDGGEPFLTALVDALSEAEDIDAVTVSEALAAADAEGTVGRLDRLAPGSWIRGDLDTWAGHPEKNQAWRRLAGAADALDEARSNLDPVRVATAHERLLRAEGSDWFWWLGDDHPTPWKREFDSLFRAHVASVYEALGRAIPDDLRDEGAPSDRPPRAAPIDVPFQPIHPRLTGESRAHFAWYGAARLPEIQRNAAMHSGTTGPIRELQFGWDDSHLYLRLLPRSGRLDSLLRGGGVDLEIDARTLDLTSARTACGAVWEAAVPRPLLGPGAATFRLILRQADGSVTRIPTAGPASLLEEDAARSPAWTA
jgi:hypothetical protein